MSRWDGVPLKSSLGVTLILLLASGPAAAADTGAIIAQVRDVLPFSADVSFFEPGRSGSNPTEMEGWAAEVASAFARDRVKANLGPRGIGNQFPPVEPDQVPTAIVLITQHDGAGGIADIDWAPTLGNIAAILNIDPTDVVVIDDSGGGGTDGAIMLDDNSAAVFHEFSGWMTDFDDPVPGTAPLDAVAEPFFAGFLPGDARVQFARLGPDMIKAVVRGVRGLVEPGGDAWERIELIIQFDKPGDGSSAVLRVIADARLAYGAGAYPADSQFTYPASEATNFAENVFTALDQYLRLNNLYVR